MGRVDVVADHLQPVIGFDAGADVEDAAVKQRPAPVRALDTTQIGADLALERAVLRLAKVMLEEDIFGRDGGVGFELEHPVAVGPLHRQQRLRRTLDDVVQSARWRSAVGLAVVESQAHLQTSIRRRLYRAGWASAKSAARKPERSAPSMVAGRPVSVQSPARMRLRQAVRAPGRLRACSGVAAKVARRSFRICQGGGSGDRSCTRATSAQSWRASAVRSASTKIG